MSTSSHVGKVIFSMENENSSFEFFLKKMYWSGSIGQHFGNRWMNNVYLYIE